MALSLSTATSENLAVETSRLRNLAPALRLTREHLLICFSVGNLLFLRRWYDLEHLKEPAMDYYRTGPANPALLGATLLSAIAMGLVLSLMLAWLKYRPSKAKTKIGRVAFLLILIYPLESVRRYWNVEGRPDLLTNSSLLTLEATLTIGVLLVVIGNLRIFTAAKRVTLLLTLLFPAFMMDFMWARVSAAPASAFAPKAPLAILAHPPATRPNRVVWLLFDEFDERLAFELHEPAVEFPELDRLRANALVATQAHQTAPWTTMALPCLLSGRLFSRVELVNATTLRAYTEGSSQPGNWADQPNLFKRAHDQGINSELIGWHHPYCRMIGDSLARCLEIPSGVPTDAMIRETSAADDGIAREIPFLFRLQLATLEEMFRPAGESITGTLRDEYVQQRQQQQYFRIRDSVYADVTDIRMGLMFAHFPAPHLFGIYNRARKDFTLTDKLTYADNLALVDRTVGEVRHVLEQAGLWETTTLLITSDHGLRPDLWRNHMGWNAELEKLTSAGQSETVPFILKLPGQTSGVIYRQPFSSVVSGDLILAILKGQISTYPETSAWLDDRATHGTFVR